MGDAPIRNRREGGGVSQSPRCDVHRRDGTATMEQGLGILVVTDDGAGLSVLAAARGRPLFLGQAFGQKPPFSASMSKSR